MQKLFSRLLTLASRIYETASYAHEYVLYMLTPHSNVFFLFCFDSCRPFFSKSFGEAHGKFNSSG